MFLLLDACCITYLVLLGFISLIRMSKSMCLANPRIQFVLCRLVSDSFERIRQTSRPCVTFNNMLVLFCSEVILTSNPSPKRRPPILGYSLFF